MLSGDTPRTYVDIAPNVRLDMGYSTSGTLQVLVPGRWVDTWEDVRDSTNLTAQQASQLMRLIPAGVTLSEAQLRDLGQTVQRTDVDPNAGKPVVLITPNNGPQSTPPMINVPPPIDLGRQEGYTPAPAELDAPNHTGNTSPMPLPTWDDLIVTSDSRILGENLTDGIGGNFGPQARPPGYEAHHIVPTNAGGVLMDELRARLAALGLTNLNQAINCVWLPGPNAPADATEAYHRRLNNDDYNDAVINEFRNVTTLDQVKDVLNDISDKLRRNAFPGARPRGG
jgi:A nuclease family of the HNH/ENDO VII superfamily with conserved AHH